MLFHDRGAYAVRCRAFQSAPFFGCGRPSLRQCACYLLIRSRCCNTFSPVLLVAHPGKRFSFCFTGQRPT